MIRASLVGVALLLLPMLSAADQTDIDPATDESEMQVVLVTGVNAGPGLWKVSSGDHVMWILGEISPFPRKLKWKSKEFERLLRRSQELLLDYSGYWWVDESNSSTLAKAARFPDATRLKDVISPELYARVEATAGKFGKPSLEEYRPFAATNRLVRSAMKTLELDGFSVRFTAGRLGEARRMRVTYFAAPELPFEERLKNWQHPSNDVCLRRLVETIGDGGNGVLLLANAWAVGDIEALRDLVPKYSFSRDGFRADDCASAMHGGEQPARDYKTRRTQAWLEQAEHALKNNKSTMAVVLMSELFESDGYLAALRARGYEITEPK